MAGYALGSNAPYGLRQEAHPGMTAIMFRSRCPKQKPAAHLCGRVLGGAIDFEQNTMFHRTGQTKFEVFFYRVWKRAGVGSDKDAEGVTPLNGKQKYRRVVPQAAFGLFCLMALATPALAQVNIKPEIENWRPKDGLYALP